MEMYIKYYQKIRSHLPMLILFLATLLVYFLSSKGEGKDYNYFVLQANAFLNGRLNILENYSWLNELVNWQGKYYSVFPPMPAILLTPFVYFFGQSFYQPALSILLGALNVALSYLVFRKLFDRFDISFVLSTLHAFGTIQWYHAEVGSAWYLAHITSLFFMWLAILEAVGKGRLFLIGLLIGGTYLSRIPTIFSILFILVYLHERFIIFRKMLIKINFRNLFLLGLGVLPAFILNSLFNFFRYGVIYDIGYTLLPIFDEPWYKYGFLSVKYIPVHLKEMFTSFPYFIDKPPFLIPNMFAMAIWFVTPAFILMLFAPLRNKLTIACIITALVVALPSLMHGGNGFSQFGYRHTLDYLPFLLLLVGLGMRNKISLFSIFLVILSIVINLWGVVMITFLNQWRI